VDECGGVAPEHRDVGYLLDGHDRRGQVDGELVPVGEGAGRGVDVNHRHGELLPRPRG